MKLHTTLSALDIRDALTRAQNAGKVARDVWFEQLDEQASRSRPNGFLIQLGTTDKSSGPGRSRHYKNSGQYGATSEWVNGSPVWAATYDEWGWFIAEVFRMDFGAKFGPYDGFSDFHARTGDRYLSGPEGSSR
jgi:hypothetical protein